jgi:hypothetical protein
MYSSSPYNLNQTPASVSGQSQPSQAPDMGTSFGYPMSPQTYPIQQQMGAQQMGGQMPQMPSQPMQVPVPGAGPVDFDMLQTTPIFDVEYTQGYLKTQIGKRIKVEFLIGTNMLVDREGTLVDVGISYIIIREVETDDLLLCDIYSIKFVHFYF